MVMCERTGEDVTLKQVQEGLGMPIYWTVPSDYPTVVSAINSGKSLVTALPRSKIAKSLRKLSDELANHRPEEASKKRPASLLRLPWCSSRFFQGVK